MMPFDSIVQVLQEAPCWHILSHVSPDGDTLGCASALYGAGEALGKKVLWSGVDPLPHRFDFLPFAERYTQRTELPDDDCCVISLDISTIGRSLPKAEGRITVNVDHHPDNSGFGLHNWIDSKAAATGELVWQIIKALGCPLDSTITTPLYVALVTDTGNFRFDSTRAATLRCGAELLQHGAESGLVDHHLNQRDPLGKLHLWGRCLTRAERVGDQGLLSWLNISDFTETDTTYADTDELVNQLTRVENANLVALVTEQEESVRCSIRSRAGFSSRKLAALWNGGGHEAAAGCHIYKNLAEALVELKEAMADAQRNSDRS